MSTGRNPAAEPSISAERAEHAGEVQTSALVAALARSAIFHGLPHEALVRLETLVLQAGQDLPSRAIRETIGSAIHLIVQQSRLRGGVRRIVSVAEITGIHDGEVQFQELFQFKQVGVSAEGKAVGYHTAMGLLPMRMEHLKAEGEDVSEHLFVAGKQPPPDKLY